MNVKIKWRPWCIITLPKRFQNNQKTWEITPKLCKVPKAVSRKELISSRSAGPHCTASIKLMTLLKYIPQGLCFLFGNLKDPHISDYFKTFRVQQVLGKYKLKFTRNISWPPYFATTQYLKWSIKAKMKL